MMVFRFYILKKRECFLGDSIGEEEIEDKLIGLD